MDYLCAKFGDCIFSRFGFIVLTNTHTNRQTQESHTGATNGYENLYSPYHGSIIEKEQ